MVSRDRSCDALVAGSACDAPSQSGAGAARRRWHLLRRGRRSYDPLARANQIPVAYGAMKAPLLGGMRESRPVSVFLCWADKRCSPWWWEVWVVWVATFPSQPQGKGWAAPGFAELADNLPEGAGNPHLPGARDVPFVGRPCGPRRRNVPGGGEGWAVAVAMLPSRRAGAGFLFRPISVRRPFSVLPGS